MTRLYHIFLVIGLVGIVCQSCSTNKNTKQPPAIIPQVQQFVLFEDESCGMPYTIIADQMVSEQSISLFSNALGLKQDLDEGVALQLQYSNEMDEEAYALTINNKGIQISASGDTGFFYALQTIIQLKQSNKDFGKLPYIEINDAPRFQWRGLHLDESRHFFGAEKVKEVLDWMAFYKLNKFHWHLVDDQGWRIEVKSYPKLTEVGGVRIETDRTKYGPFFYTQEEIREIVEYASERHIEVIPEIELPGHVTSALAAYPELSCRQKQLNVGNTWGVYNDVYCAGNEKVYQFLEDVFAEVVDLFPGRYVHIGGDECPKERWQTCKKCQEKITTENLKNEEELQSYFIERVAGFLHKKDKIVVGWDEIMLGYTPQNAVIMSWHGTECGEIAVRNGNPAVMTPSSHLYFNKYQGDTESEPLSMTGFIPLEKVYGFNPMPQGLNEVQEHLVLGVQACLWSEHIKTDAKLDYMLMPRLQALAEVAWTLPKNKDWTGFSERIQKHYPILEQEGINYHVAMPQDMPNKVVFTDEYEISLSVGDKNSKIYYSLNGSEFMEFKKRFSVNETTELQAYSQMKTGKKSKLRNILLQKQAPLKSIQPSNLKGPGLSVKIFNIQENELWQDTAGWKLKLDDISLARGQIKDGNKGIIRVETFIKVPETGIYEFEGHPDLLKIDEAEVLNCTHKSKRILYRAQVALEKGWHKLEARFTVHEHLSMPASKVKTEMRWRRGNEEWEALKPYCFTN